MAALMLSLDRQVPRAEPASQRQRQSADSDSVGRHTAGKLRNCRHSHGAAVQTCAEAAASRPDVGGVRVAWPTVLLQATTGRAVEAGPTCAAAHRDDCSSPR